MKQLKTKEGIGFIAILITFLGSEIVLDYWLGIQSITTKCWFVFMVVLVYYVIIEQFFTEKKNQSKNKKSQI